jgi:hypothetical protein
MHVYLEMASTHMMNKMTTFETMKRQNPRRSLLRQDTQTWESLQTVATDAMFNEQQVRARASVKEGGGVRLREPSPGGGTLTGRRGVFCCRPPHRTC